MLKEELQKLKEGEQPQTLDELFEGSKEDIMRERVVSQINAILPQMRDRILGELQTLVTEQIRAQIEGIRVRDGEDGKTPTDSELKTLIKPLIPKLPTPEKLKELKVEDVKGLQNLIKGLSNRITSKGGASGGGSTMRVENLSSQADGSTKAFTTTYRIGSSHLLFYSSFPSLFLPTTDYSVLGMTVTLGSSVNAPVAGQSLAIIYEEG